MKKQLFDLLSLGLQLVVPLNSHAESCSLLKEDEWIEIKTLADKQGVSAIVLDGVSVLGLSFGYDLVAHGVGRNWWKVFFLKWVGATLVVEDKNQSQKLVLNEMSKKWSDNGIQVMVFKGQANGLMYPNPNHRNPGDIDCYLFGQYKKGNEVARNAGAIVDEGWYKHSEVFYKDELFENHLYFVTTRSGKKYMALNKELENELCVDKTLFGRLDSMTLVPPIQWMAMFLAYHSCAHFLVEGLRLKQVIDWTMFLDTHQNEVDWDAFYLFCERYHLRRFAIALTAISKDYFGVKITNNKIEFKSPFANEIMNSIIYDDDYIYNKEEGGWKEKQHIIRNLFKYRWKYEDIYQESVWKQLWLYASGYLFRKEKFLA